MRTAEKPQLILKEWNFPFPIPIQKLKARDMASYMWFVNQMFIPAFGPLID